MIEDAMEVAVIDGGGGGGKGGSRKTKKAATDNGTNISADSPSQLESSFKLESGLYYDEYGFLKGQNASSPNSEDDALLTKAKSFDMYSRDLQDSLGEPGDYEVSRCVKWENYVTSQWAMGGAK